MSNASERLDIYEDMLERSRAMLESARHQEWDALIQQRARYVADVEALRRGPRGEQLNAQERQYCARMIEEILEHDRVIREQLDARCEELTQLIGSSRRQQALVRAYNQGQGTLSQRTRPSQGTEGRT
ncbi:flagellar protein FliT [Chromohalobacter sarecensis]|uniref:Flagellar protein FliT n=1 Tax=Chromohalobacter sarecensis TaxID=245294 RepID=A0ABV9D392_9GAMM|nr:flagellar protein FliT [Chromohalobacter sarecensis]MCK0714776.1 flagellar protein FliT [Chromohalobacter sarecensis]